MVELHKWINYKYITVEQEIDTTQMDFTQEDRDLLIKHEVKIDQVCKAIHNLDTKFDKIVEKIDNCTENTISKTMFRWVIGIIVGGILILTGYTANMNTQVIKNTICIEQNDKEINEHHKESKGN